MVLNRSFDSDRRQAASVVLELTNVTKTFTARRRQRSAVLRGVNLSVTEGERVALVGPSGCGKTTLLRIVGGLEPRYGGTVRIAAPTTGVGITNRLASTMVFQQDSLLPWMTAKRNIVLGLAGLGLDKEVVAKRVRSSLDLVGLHEAAGRYPHELSGGMKQRVAIARALACEPFLLLMDEPLAALDAQTRILVEENLLSIWAQTNSTTLYVTHDIEEAVTVADRVIVLGRGGRIAEESRTPPMVYDSGGHADIWRYRAQAEVASLVREIWEVIRREVGGRLQTSEDVSRSSTGWRSH